MNASSPAAFPLASAKAQPPLLLLVDDARVIRIALQETLEGQGYGIIAAENGEEALDLLGQHAARIHAVVLDREMPGIDGLEVVRRMKLDPRLGAIPVIMFTATSAPEKIQEGIDAGVYHYLIKPADGMILKSVIESALRERRQGHALAYEPGRYGAALRLLHSGQMSFSTLTQAEDAACLLATCFPDPERIAAGLVELFVNAIEHGNLGIHYEEKRRLLAENRWREEIERRGRLPENTEKRVDVIYQRKDGMHLVQISDSGPGFDWKSYWHINPARATSSHGRGIARARLMAFDRMSYNEKGNSVTVMSSSNPTHATAGYAW
jgi:CheY-like chemotaxis protein/anti-sigma regulatory factor (Ser/Thr protein kinase)